MNEVSQLTPGKAQRVSSDLVIYSTRQFSRRASLFILAAYALMLIFAFSEIAAIAGLIVFVVGLAFLYDWLIVNRITVQPDGVSRRLSFLDFTIQHQFIAAAEVRKCFPVKTNNRNGISFSVEILHSCGEISLDNFNDVEAAEEFVDYVASILGLETHKAEAGQILSDASERNSN